MRSSSSSAAPGGATRGGGTAPLVSVTTGFAEESRTCAARSSSFSMSESVSDAGLVPAVGGSCEPTAPLAASSVPDSRAPRTSITFSAPRSSNRLTFFEAPLPATRLPLAAVVVDWPFVRFTLGMTIVVCRVRLRARPPLSRLGGFSSAGALLVLGLGALGGRFAGLDETGGRLSRPRPVVPRAVAELVAPTRDFACESVG